MSWDSFRAGAKDFAGRAADKINQTADIAAIQFKISGAEHRLATAFEALGKVAFQYFTSTENPPDKTSVEEAISSVTAINQEIADLNHQLETLKAK